MNGNKEVTQVTVSTVQRSDFSVPVGQTNLGDNGVVVEEEGQRTFIPYDNVIHITYDLEEIEEKGGLEAIEVAVPKDDEWTKEEIREWMNRIREESGDEGDEEEQNIQYENTHEDAFAYSVENETLEQDYTVTELGGVLAEIDDVKLINQAIEVDGRSTAVEEYEDRLEDLRDEGQ